MIRLRSLNILLLVILLLMNGGSQGVAADLYTLAWIDYADLNQRDQLASRLDIWEVRPQISGGSLLALLSPDDQVWLVDSGYSFRLDRQATAALNSIAPALSGQPKDGLDLSCYRTVEETHADLSALVAANPNLAEWIDIGDSWEKVTPDGAPGYDLYVLKLTNRAVPGPKPAFFLMAAIHAREMVTAELAARFAEHLAGGYGQDAEITWLLDHTEIHVLAQANPDGRKLAEAGFYWRKNTDADDGCFNPSLVGVDLNRNSSFLWGGSGSSPDACSDTYHGPSPASEPEVQALQNYISGLFADRRGPALSDAAPLDTPGLFITLHSYSRLVLWPWGWTKEPSPNAAAFEILGQKLAYFNNYLAEQSSGLYTVSGSNDDWAYGELGVAALTYEIGTAFFQDCQTFEEKIYPENLKSLLYAAKAAGLPFMLPAGPDTLDLQVTPPVFLAGSELEVQAVADDSRYAKKGYSQVISGTLMGVDQPASLSASQLPPMLPLDGAFNEPIETVTASLHTTGWESGRHTLFAESQDSAGNWGPPAATFVCVAAAEHAAALAPSEAFASAAPGRTARYRLALQNQGLISETLQVSLDGNAWPAVITSPPQGTAPCETASLQIEVQIPPSALPGEIDRLTITAVSSAGGLSAQSVLTTTVVDQRLFYLPFAPVAASR